MTSKPASCSPLTSFFNSSQAAAGSEAVAKLGSGAKKLYGALPIGPKPGPPRVIGVSITAVTPKAFMSCSLSSTPKNLPANSQVLCIDRAFSAQISLLDLAISPALIQKTFYNNVSFPPQSLAH